MQAAPSVRTTRALTNIRRRRRVKRIYVQVLSALAHADGRLLDQETAAIDQGLRNVGLLDESEFFRVLATEHTKPLDDVELEYLSPGWEREALVTLMFAVTWADDECSPLERALIDAVATRLKIPDARIAKLESTVTTQRMALDRA